MYLPVERCDSLNGSRFPLGVCNTALMLAMSRSPPSPSVVILTVSVCPCFTEWSPASDILGGAAGVGAGDVLDGPVVGLDGAFNILTAILEELIAAMMRSGRNPSDEKKRYARVEV